MEYEWFCVDWVGYDVVVISFDDFVCYCVIQIVVVQYDLWQLWLVFGCVDLQCVMVECVQVFDWCVVVEGFFVFQCGFVMFCEVED